MEIKAKQVYVDKEGNLYKIKEILENTEHFTYSFKNRNKKLFQYQGVHEMAILIDEIKQGNLILYSKTSRILFGPK